MSEYEGGIQPVLAPRVSHDLLHRSASLHGFWLVHYLQQAPAHIQKLQRLVEEDKPKLIVDEGQFTGFTGAIEALERMYTGKNIGKLVVDFTTT